MKIRDAISMIEKDGRRLVAQKGSHRQFKHPIKPGRVTIAGALSDELAPGTPNDILKQARLRGKLTMEYLVVIEKAGKGFSAHSGLCSNWGDSGDGKGSFGRSPGNASCRARRRRASRTAAGSACRLHLYIPVVQ